MIKNFIIDTNVMVHDPMFLYNFEDNNIIIPIVCIEELDNLKQRKGLVGYQARTAARELSKIRKLGNLHDGVKLLNGGTIRVELNNNDVSILPNGLDISKNDNRILAITKNIQKNSNIPTILVSKDLYMTIKADALGILVQDYENDKLQTDDLYKGFTEISLPSTEIDKIFIEGLTLPVQITKNLYPNEFLHIKSNTNDNHVVLGRYNGNKVVPLKHVDSVAWGLIPINKEQKMAYELLMDDDINFVSITGGAGSGKTILSTAVAFEKVFNKHKYRKIIFVKPTIPAGNDIGYLPGTESEKLTPWMGSFYDSVENLTNIKRNYNISKNNNKYENFNVDKFINDFREMGIIETKTFTYMRGRTYSDSLVIVDEAQEITPHLAKLMLTRAGVGSKFVFIGDPTDNQIDNVLVDEKSNGLVYAIEKMKPFEITGHVTLQKVERSPLAKIAEKYM